MADNNGEKRPKAEVYDQEAIPASQCNKTQNTVTTSSSLLTVDVVKTEEKSFQSQRQSTLSVPYSTSTEHTQRVEERIEIQKEKPLSVFPVDHVHNENETFTQSAAKIKLRHSSTLLDNGEQNKLLGEQMKHRHISKPNDDTQFEMYPKTDLQQSTIQSDNIRTSSHINEMQNKNQTRRPHFSQSEVTYLADTLQQTLADMSFMPPENMVESDTESVEYTGENEGEEETQHSTFILRSISWENIIVHPQLEAKQHTRLSDIPLSLTEDAESVRLASPKQNNKAPEQKQSLWYDSNFNKQAHQSIPHWGFDVDILDMDSESEEITPSTLSIIQMNNEPESDTESVELNDQQTTNQPFILSTGINEPRKSVENQYKMPKAYLSDNIKMKVKGGKQQHSFNRINDQATPFSDDHAEILCYHSENPNDSDTESVEQNDVNVPEHFLLRSISQPMEQDVHFFDNYASEIITDHNKVFPVQHQTALSEQSSMSSKGMKIAANESQNKSSVKKDPFARRRKLIYLTQTLKKTLEDMSFLQRKYSPESDTGSVENVAIKEDTKLVGNTTATLPSIPWEDIEVPLHKIQKNPWYHNSFENQLNQDIFVIDEDFEDESELNEEFDELFEIRPTTFSGILESDTESIELDEIRTNDEKIMERTNRGHAVEQFLDVIAEDIKKVEIKSTEHRKQEKIFDHSEKAERDLNKPGTKSTNHMTQGNAVNLSNVPLKHTEKSETNIVEPTEQENAVDLLEIPSKDTDKPEKKSAQPIKQENVVNPSHIRLEDIDLSEAKTVEPTKQGDAVDLLVITSEGTDNLETKSIQPKKQEIIGVLSEDTDKHEAKSMESTKQKTAVNLSNILSENELETKSSEPANQESAASLLSITSKDTGKSEIKSAEPSKQQNAGDMSELTLEDTDKPATEPTEKLWLIYQA